MANFFEKFKKNKNDKKSEWAGLSEVEFSGGAEKEKQAENEARQRRKIGMALLNSNEQFLGVPNAEMSSSDEMRLYDAMNEGRINEGDEKWMLGKIKDPVMKYGIEGVYGQIEGDKHHRRILATLVGADFDDWDKTGKETLGIFLQQYPFPMDMEERGEKLLDDIKRSNSDEKYQEYVRDMAVFKKTVYGKRQEYWERIKELKDEAEKRAKEGAVTEQLQNHEQGEKLVTGMGWFEASRGQVSGQMLSQISEGERLPFDDTIQDAHFEMPEKGLFGVFDGAGGHNGGREASQTAVRKLAELANMYDFSTEDNVAWAMNELSKAVEANPNAGYSTGVIGQIVENEGRKRLLYASVGDSRIYVVGRGGETVRMITRDEGEGKFVTNALGAIKGRESENRTRQFGAVELRAGDRIVFCSDGITGDKEADLMGDGEMAGTVGLAWNAGQAAQELVERARKNDDRVAVVVEV